MPRRFLYKKIFAAALVTTVALGIAQIRAQEANPEFMVSWRAESYVPPEFTGKTLPTEKSPITVSFELVQDGKLLDLSPEDVYWYIDDEFLEGGKGLKTVSFRATEQAGSSHEVLIQINSFRKKSNIVSTAFNIPVARPDAVIDAPFPGGVFSNTNVRLHARPYFFNVKSISNLVFSWKVNGQSPTNAENPASLDINLTGAQATTDVNVGLTIQNPKATFEGGASRVSLRYGQR